MALATPCALVEEAMETIKIRDNAGADFTTIYGVNHPILGAESKRRRCNASESKTAQCRNAALSSRFTL
ncbi:hypothetical protein JV197_19570 [Vibrio furnissii]|nr:hypothetical protein JV197_19570 [Vibrio furnissii]